MIVACSTAISQRAALTSLGQCITKCNIIMPATLMMVWIVVMMGTCLSKQNDLMECSQFSGEIA